MGIALADSAVEYGASVVLVLGPTSISPINSSIKIINVITAETMAKECISRFSECDIAILTAAVADFTPSDVKDRKIKKEDSDFIVRLKPTTDIAYTLGMNKKPNQILAGFALETDNEYENAKAKLERKNLDLIVLNMANEEGAGFSHDTNRITIIDKYNNIDKFELKSKVDAAKDILNKIVSIIK
jgi:phosphopantothenoylcysteine decarboxylase/phosphopantothenate--cysteine ligase